MTKETISRRKFLKTATVGGAAVAGATLAAPAIASIRPGRRKTGRAGTEAWWAVTTANAAGRRATRLS